MTKRPLRPIEVAANMMRRAHFAEFGGERPTRKACQVMLRAALATFATMAVRNESLQVPGLVTFVHRERKGGTMRLPQGEVKVAPHTALVGLPWKSLRLRVRKGKR